MNHIKVPILNDEYFVTVCWGDVDAEGLKLLSTLTDGNATAHDLENQRGLMWAHEGWKYQPVIYICEPTTSDRFFSTLSHEATHCVRALWNKLEECGEGEIFAYSVGAIVYAVENKIKAIK